MRVARVIMGILNGFLVICCAYLTVLSIMAGEPPLLVGLLMLATIALLTLMIAYLMAIGDM